MGFELSLLSSLSHNLTCGSAEDLAYGSAGALYCVSAFCLAYVSVDSAYSTVSARTQFN